MCMLRGGIKLFLLAGVCWLALIVEGVAQDQPIKINIQLPAGVGLSAKSPQSGKTAGAQSGSLSSSGISESAKVDFAFISENGIVIPLTWIQMKSLENTQFLLEFRDEAGQRVDFEAYFLNDQSDNLAEAKAYRSFPALLQFDNSGFLIRNKVPRSVSVKSWLGIPAAAQDNRIVLEYF